MRHMIWFFVGQVVLLIDVHRTTRTLGLATLLTTLVMLLVAGLAGDFFGWVVSRLFRRWSAGGPPKGVPPTAPV